MNSTTAKNSAGFRVGQTVSFPYRGKNHVGRISKVMENGVGVPMRVNGANATIWTANHDVKASN